MEITNTKGNFTIEKTVANKGFSIGSLKSELNRKKEKKKEESKTLPQICLSEVSVWLKTTHLCQFQTAISQSFKIQIWSNLHPF